MGERLATFWRGLNWPKIVGETIIIVVGVFLGIQASNWNDARIERAETARLLHTLKPEMRNLLQLYGTIDDYYGVSRDYADTAFPGWRNDAKVSDRAFIIAAYQASQNYFMAASSGSWSQIFGSEVRSLDDLPLRRELSAVMYADYSPMKTTNLYTDYRKNVRRVIPLALQDQIRARCGDRTSPDNGVTTLPATCDLAINTVVAKAAAAKLRANPELADDLGYHFAVIAVALTQSQNLGKTMHQLLRDIDRYVGGEDRR